MDDKKFYPLHWKTCAWCGKPFTIEVLEMWRLKRNVSDGVIYFHKWSCLRAYEKDGHPYKNWMCDLGKDEDL